MLPTLIVIVIVAGILVIVLSLTGKERTGWVQFYAKGKDSGFSFREIELLRQLAVKSKLEEPSSLFWSQTQLDQGIRSLVKSMQFSGEINDQANQSFLSKLYDFRKKIEMEKPRIKNGISNSRQIGDGQALRILVPGTGVFKSQVIKNTNNYLTISRPTNSKITQSFSWQGVKVSVYFWRTDDAGYVFDSEVHDEGFSKGLASLKLAHSEALFRTQKRKSIRMKLHKPAFLYPLASDEEAGKIEANPGLKCFLEDLSDTGCAITIGGMAWPNMRLKVQFALGNTPITMSGTVRSAEFKEDLNRSTLHVEADPLPIEIRNKILGEVFGTLPEEEEELPFRVLEEEAEEMAADAFAVLADNEDSDSMGTPA
ncbi:MAG: PilZ domain-containing protein [Treponema sp.]|nr:PilZ domain-containing protein [Treponema sp.]